MFVEEEGVLCSASPLLNLGKGGSDVSFEKASVGVVPVGTVSRTKLGSAQQKWMIQLGILSISRVEDS